MDAFIQEYVQINESSGGAVVGEDVRGRADRVQDGLRGWSVLGACAGRVQPVRGVGFPAFAVAAGEGPWTR